MPDTFLNNEPVVGQGATIHYGSDSHAYEVISVRPDKKQAVIQSYATKCIDHEQQEYVYDELIGQQFPLVFRWKAWRKVCKNWNGTGKTYYPKVNITFGVRREYYDPSF